VIIANCSWTRRPSPSRNSPAHSSARVLERRAERDGRERGARALDRRVELVERGRLDLGGDLRGEAAVRYGLVGDDEAMRPGE
jgi:hypothetical protein